MFFGLSIIQLIMILGAVAILFIVLKQLNITIPDWVIQILWVIAIVFVGVWAVKFIFSAG
jgi:hypothetical protein